MYSDAGQPFNQKQQRTWLHGLMKLLRIRRILPSLFVGVVDVGFLGLSQPQQFWSFGRRSSMISRTEESISDRSLGVAGVTLVDTPGVVTTAVLFAVVVVIPGLVTTVVLFTVLFVGVVVAVVVVVGVSELSECKVVVRPTVIQKSSKCLERKHVYSYYPN